MSEPTGKFIVVEGGEGVGKSTNIDYIKVLLEESGKKVVVTREPGGTALGEKIRELLLDKDGAAINADTELLLMFAARAQHIAEVIMPALERGQWVLCDRFTDASYAYQGGGRGLPLDRIASLEDWVQGALCPDSVIILDAPTAIGAQRVTKRGDKDRFEQEANAFFERVRNTYLQRAESDPSRYHVIDASQPLEQVQSSIKTVLTKILSV